MYISGVGSRTQTEEQRARERARELVWCVIFVIYVEMENTFKKKRKGRLA